MTTKEYQELCKHTSKKVLQKMMEEFEESTGTAKGMFKIKTADTSK